MAIIVALLGELSAYVHVTNVDNDSHWNSPERQAKAMLLDLIDLVRKNLTGLFEWPPEARDWYFTLTANAVRVLSQSHPSYAVAV